MKSKIKIPAEVLMNIDFFNTVNGGMSEPSVKIENVNDGYQVSLKTPGIATDDLQVEVIDNRLVVYHLIPIYRNRPDEETEMKSIRLLNNHTIPNHVDIESVSAEYDDNKKAIKIFFPNKPEHNNLRRVVDIKK